MVLVCDRFSAYRKLARELAGKVILQWCWAHQRRSFIDCAAGRVRLRRWCQRWIERIAEIYRLNDARLEHYDRAHPLECQTPAFDAAHAMLNKAVDELFAAAEAELAAVVDERGAPARTRRAGMTSAVECRYYGRDFTADEMALLRALIAGPAPLSRRALSIEFCRRVGWLKPDGGLKDMMARVTMLAMHRDGLIELPAPRWQRGRPRPIVFGPDTEPPMFPAPTSLDEVRPLQMRTVRPPQYLKRCAERPECLALVVRIHRHRPFPRHYRLYVRFQALVAAPLSGTSRRERGSDHAITGDAHHCAHRKRSMDSPRLRSFDRRASSRADSLSGFPSPTSPGGPDPGLWRPRYGTFGAESITRVREA